MNYEDIAFDQPLDPLLLQALAHNPNTPARVLAAVAEHDNTPAEILADLAQVRVAPFGFTRRDFVQTCVARNPRTPATALDAMTKPGSAAVRTRVAGNPNAAPSTLARLAKSPDYNVCQAVMINPSTPAYVLDKLATSRNPYVLRVVTQRPDAAPWMLQLLWEQSWGETSLNCSYLAAVAEHPNTPMVVLEQAAASSVAQVRAKLLENPQCTWQLALTALLVNPPSGMSGSGPLAEYVKGPGKRHHITTGATELQVLMEVVGAGMQSQLTMPAMAAETTLALDSWRQLEPEQRVLCWELRRLMPGALMSEVILTAADTLPAAHITVLAGKGPARARAVTRAVLGR